MPKRTKAGKSSLTKEEKLRIKKKLDKLDAVKEKLVSKLKNKVISKKKEVNGKKTFTKGKDGKTISIKGGAKSFKAGVKGYQKKGGRGGKPDGGKRFKKPTSEALDKELDNYWIKKGETGTV